MADLIPPHGGLNVREALAAGKLPDPRVMCESSARILIEAKHK